MNASAEAYEWLEAKGEGMYERMVGEVLASDGVLVQAPDFLLAVIIEGRCGHVIFAYGDLRKMVLFAKANASVWGVDKVAWERCLVGKHKDTKIYKINKLHICQKEQDTV